MSLNREVRQLNSVIVDDDLTKQNRLRLALKTAGARVCWAVTSPEDLVARVERNELDPEHIDAVFLDAYMQKRELAGQAAMHYLVSKGLVRTDRVIDVDGRLGQEVDDKRVVLVGSSMEPDSSFGLGSYALTMNGPLMVDWEHLEQHPLGLRKVVLAVHSLRGIEPIER
jgi:hypothetical protein